MQTGNRFLHFICLVVLLSALACPFLLTNPAAANPDRLAWSVISTPSKVNNVLAPNSEVNFIAIGSDDVTIYAVDATPAHSNVYKSEDAGISWDKNITRQLTPPYSTAVSPFWNIAVAPDNKNIVAVVTSVQDPISLLMRPREVYISFDGGNNWNNTNLYSLLANEDISVIEISGTYGINQHDIAVGTKKGRIAPDLSPGQANGNVYALELSNTSTGTWKKQSLGGNGWTNNSDVIALKFSPNYNGDGGLAAVISNTHTYLDQGRRDTGANLTVWRTLTIGSQLVELSLTPSQSAAFNEIISACIQLPSDFSCATPSSQRYYISYDDNLLRRQSGIYRIDYNVAFRIFQSAALSPSPTVRISSIAFYGTNAGGILLAGQVKADPISLTGDLWKTTDPVTITPPPVWTKAVKPPTGGASLSLMTNMQVAWNPSGNRVYCGTSSADLANAPFGDWTRGYLSMPGDESAFSVSPYSTIYQQRLEYYKQPLDTDYGMVWNQIGLIDTFIDKLSDVAALEVPSNSILDYTVVYLATTNLLGFDSIWRSVPDINSIYNWERTSTVPSNGSLIIRVFTGNSYLTSDGRSNCLAIAEVGTSYVKFSPNEGQLWMRLNPDIGVNDMALESDAEIFVADDVSVRKATIKDSNWSWSTPISTGLTNGHSIYVLPGDATTSINNKKADEWVLVGDSVNGRVAYCDFSGNYPQVGGSPRFYLAPPLPLIGEVHVCMNDHFTQNRMIFAGVTDAGGITGKLYRWVLGKNQPDWTELLPPDQAFFGLAINRDVLYGAWQNASPSNQPPGVDRTLYATQAVPPRPEWDSLSYGLPRAPATTVRFTNEPVALKLSAGDYNDLWAIDNRVYDADNPDPTLRQGLLWAYSDTLARRGPFPSSPAAGGLAPFDPKTGRAGQINFQWFQLQDAGDYELVAAKDAQFTMIVFDILSIRPPYPALPSKPPPDQTVPFPTLLNQNSPAWILPAGSILEEGHEYFWRVRASGSIQGQAVHSPWSATMHFTVMRGLPVETHYYGPVLLSPANSCGCSCNSTTNFSWAPYPNTNKYLFELSERQDMALPLVSTEVPATAYQYAGQLKCGSSYYWRVHAISAFPSDWSATFTFRTQTPVEGSPSASPVPTSGQTPMSTGVVIGMVIVGALLDICVLVLIIRTKGD